MADEASLSTSLAVLECFNRVCERSAEYYFECSRTGCSGPSIPPALEVVPNKRIALCDHCAHRDCPFCSSAVQREDLHLVTDRPATLTSADEDGRPSDGPAASGISSWTDYQTLDQFNQHFEELANKVKTNMRKLSREPSIRACDRPGIAELVEEARDLLKCLEKKGLQPDRDTYRWLLSLSGRAKHQEKVEEWAQKMEESGNCSTDAYNSIMFGFAVPRGVDRADMWFKRMQQNECVPNTKSFTILIQACAISRDSTRANFYFERMQDAKIKPDVWTFGHLIKACANERQDPLSLQKAQKIWEDMQQADLKPNMFTCNAMLYACVKPGNIDKASQIFEEGVKAGCAPDVVTFTTVITVFIKTGDVQGAEEWFRKMEAAEVRPNVVAFTCMIRVCATTGDEPNAHKWLAKMEAAGYRPSQQTYAALIICGLNRKDFDQADLWVQRMLMLDSGVLTIKVFHKLLEECELAGNLMQAEKLFNAMEKVGVPPDVRAYNSMLRTSAEFDSSQRRQMSGQPSEEQKKWFLKMSSSGVQPDEATFDILKGQSATQTK